MFYASTWFEYKLNKYHLMINLASRYTDFRAWFVITYYPRWSSLEVRSEFVHEWEISSNPQRMQKDIFSLRIIEVFLHQFLLINDFSCISHGHQNILKERLLLWPWPWMCWSRHCFTVSSIEEDKARSYRLENASQWSNFQRH